MFFEGRRYYKAYWNCWWSCK